MKKVLLISFLLFFFTTSFAGISTKKKDTLKLIGTSYALNGNFAWIELNGEDYGWNREGGTVGQYRIVMNTSSFLPSILTKHPNNIILQI